MPVESGGGNRYEYVVVNNRYTQGCCDTSRTLRDIQGCSRNEPQMKMRGVMSDEMKDICEREGIRLHMSVGSPESNGVTERMIGVLTNAVRPILHDSGLPSFLWAETFSARRVYIIGHRRRR